METTAILIYRLVILIGTTYLVVNFNWSMWAYLLAAIFCSVTRCETDDQ